MYMAGTVSTSSLALFRIVATTFSALHLVERHMVMSPLTASSWSATVLALAAHFFSLCKSKRTVKYQLNANNERQHHQNPCPSTAFLILKYQYSPLSSAFPRVAGLWVTKVKVYFDIDQMSCMWTRLTGCDRL